MRDLRLAYCLMAAIVVLGVALGSAFIKTDMIELFSLDLGSFVAQIWLFPPLIWVASAAVRIVHRRFAHPTKAIVRIVCRERWYLLLGLALTAMQLPFGPSFSALKGAIPSLVPFYADPYLVALDRMLFLGIDPWRLTHAVIGPMGTRFLESIYMGWFAVIAGMLAWLNFSRDRHFQVRGLITFFATWLFLGFFMAAALSSVGPCFYADFYGDNHFAPLMQALESQAPASTRAMTFLRDAGDSGSLGSGISAMPSLHVALAFLFVLVCREGAPWVTWPAIFFFTLIWVASVHLGWHYAVDGLVSAVSVACIWKGAGALTTRRLEAPHHRLTPASGGLAFKLLRPLSAGDPIRTNPSRLH